jgi:hypothetical protein
MWVTKYSAYSITCNKCCVLFHIFRHILLIYFLTTFTPLTFLNAASQVMEHASSHIMLYRMSWLNGYHPALYLGGHGFKSRPGDELRFSVVLSFLPGKWRDNILN